MRNTIKTLAIGLGLLATTAANAQMAYYVEAANSFTPRDAGNGFGTGIFVSGAYKFSDTLKGGVEYAQSLTYMDAGKTKLDQAHKVLRFPLTRSGLNWIGGDWKTSFTTRWTAPTTAAHQKAGGWGSVLLRPAFSLEGKIWSVLIRPQVSIGLVDRAYEKFVTPGATCTHPTIETKKILCTPKGNTLASWTFEFIPSYKISNDMSLTLSSYVTQAFKGGAPGADAAFETASLFYELIADIPFKTGPVSYAVAVESTTKFNKTFKAFDPEKSAYTLYVMANF